MADGDSEIVFKTPAKDQVSDRPEHQEIEESELQGDNHLNSTQDRTLTNLPPHEEGVTSTPTASHTALRDPSSGDCRPIAKIVVKPEKYEGKGDWSEYISHFNDCAALGNWDDRTKCLILAANLHGAARKYYTGLSADEKKHYERLTSALRRRFGGEHRQDSWLYKLEMRKRKTGESAADLGDDIWLMAQRAYYDFDQRSQEQLALKHFYRVLDSDMKVKCVENHCSNIADAVDVVERYEALYEDRKDGKRSTVRAVETARPSSIEEDLKKIIKQIEVLQDRQDKQEQKFSRDNRNTSQGGPRRRNNGQLCFGCGAPDHFISVCPQRSSSGQQSRGNHAAAQSRSAGNFHPSN